MKNERRAVVNDRIRHTVISLVLVALAASTSVAASPERPEDVPSDADLARAETLMREMLDEVRALRAADPAERRVLWGALRRNLVGGDSIAGDDRLCPMCPMLLQQEVAQLPAMETMGRAIGDDQTAQGPFLAAFPQVPLIGCAGRSSFVRPGAVSQCAGLEPVPPVSRFF
jgi:hypothetical protein